MGKDNEQGGLSTGKESPRWRRGRHCRPCRGDRRQEAAQRGRRPAAGTAAAEAADAAEVGLGALALGPGVGKFGARQRLGVEEPLGRFLGVVSQQGEVVGVVEREPDAQHRVPQRGLAPKRLVRRRRSQQPHEGAALQPGQAPEHRRPLQHDEAAARARDRARDVLGAGPRSGAGLLLHPRLHFSPLSTVPR